MRRTGCFRGDAPDDLEGGLRHESLVAAHGLRRGGNRRMAVTGGTVGRCKNVIRMVGAAVAPTIRLTAEETLPGAGWLLLLG